MFKNKRNLCEIFFKNKTPTNVKNAFMALINSLFKVQNFNEKILAIDDKSWAQLSW